MFTVQLKDADQVGSQQVEIYLDEEGLRDLLAQLSFLRQAGDHAHFFTEEWGGLPLDSTPIGDDAVIVNQMLIERV